MIRASSLFYSLMVALLLGALLSAVIMSAHLRSSLTERWLAYNTARDDAYGALGAELLGIPMLRTTTDSLKLFSTSEQYTTIAHSIWGLFNIRTGVGHQADQQVSRCALMGWHCDPLAPSLWVADNNEPISMAGEARLTGACYLPARGLRRAYIEGRPYTGSLTLDDQRLSGSAIPPLPERIQAQIRSFTDGLQASEGAVSWSDLAHDSIDVAFAEPALVADLGSVRELSNAHVFGHVLLLALDSVRLTSSFRCSGIVIWAPHVTIASGFIGDMQCFTRFGVLMESDTRLNYPSVLVSTGGDSTHSATISIGERSVFEGAIIGWPMARRAKPVTVEFSQGTVFDGEVWNDGPVQLQGSMRGTVVANSVLLRTPSSVYRGHIMDVQLGPSIHREQVGIGVWGDQSDIAVLHWLDRHG
jgi:hypothetical protein